MADVKVTFLGDGKSAEATIARLEKANADLQEKMKHGSESTSKAMVADIKRWQQANDDAMSAGVAAVRNREKITQAAIEASRRSQDQAAKETFKFEQQKLAHRADVMRRVREMEAARPTAFLGTHAGVMANQAADERGIQRQENIRAAIRLSEIRRTEMAAARARHDEAEGLKANALAVDSLAMKVVGLGTAYKVVSSAISGVIAKNEEFLSKLDAMGQIRADEELKLQIQGGMVPEEIAKQMPAIEKAVAQTPSVGGATPQEMFAATIALTTQLASSNVKDPEALAAVLKLKAGTNRFGRGIGGEAADVRSLVQFLKGVGKLDPKAADLLKVGGGISEVFEASDLQFSDISHLSPHAATLKSLGMDAMQQLAAFATLTDVQGGELSGRGLKMVRLRLATAKENEASGKALGELNLTPEQVAIAQGGLSMTESMKLIRSRMMDLPVEQQNRIAEGLFGQEAIGIAQTLLAPGRLEQIEAWTEKARKAEGFESKVSAFETSRFARDRANVAATGFSLRRQDIATGEYTWRELENEKELIRSRDSEGRSAGSRAFLNFGAYTEDFFNWAFNKARGATPTEAGYENPNQTRQTELLERIAVGVEHNTSAVEKTAERRINRNAGVETPAH